MNLAYTSLLEQFSKVKTYADDVIAVTVQPYMRKYGRLIVPRN